MKNKLPLPFCSAFLACRSVALNPQTTNIDLLGLARAFWTNHFPAATPISLFFRCTSGHGMYPVEVQMQNTEGEVVWKAGPSDPWAMIDPLEMYDHQFNTCVIFPAAGVYQLVLVLDGEEVSRQKFHAKLGQVPIRKPKANS